MAVLRPHFGRSPRQSLRPKAVIHLRRSKFTGWAESSRLLQSELRSEEWGQHLK